MLNLCNIIYFTPPTKSIYRFPKVKYCSPLPACILQVNCVLRSLLNLNSLSYLRSCVLDAVFVSRFVNFNVHFRCTSVAYQ